MGWLAKSPSAPTARLTAESLSRQEESDAFLELDQGRKPCFAGKLGLVEARKKSLAVYRLKLRFGGSICV